MVIKCVLDVFVMQSWCLAECSLFSSEIAPYYSCIVLSSENTAACAKVLSSIAFSCMTLSKEM